MIDYTRLLDQLDPEPGGEDPLRRRTAIVDEVNSDGTLDIILSGVLIENVPRLSAVGAIEGDAVQVQTSRGSLLVVGVIASVSTPNLLTSFGINAAAVTAGTNDTSSGTYADMAGTGSVTSFPVTKRYTESRLEVAVHASMFSTTSQSSAQVGIRINAVDHNLVVVTPAVNSHATGSAIERLSGIPSGLYTAQMRWRRSAGTGGLRRDTGDWLSVTVREVSA